MVSPIVTPHFHEYFGRKPWFKSNQKKLVWSSKLLKRASWRNVDISSWAFARVKTHCLYILASLCTADRLGEIEKEKKRRIHISYTSPFKGSFDVTNLLSETFRVDFYELNRKGGWKRHIHLPWSARASSLGMGSFEGDFWTGLSVHGQIWFQAGMISNNISSVHPKTGQARGSFESA